MIGRPQAAFKPERLKAAPYIGDGFMKQFKKFVPILLALVMLLSVLGGAFAAPQAGGWTVYLAGQEATVAENEETVTLKFDLSLLPTDAYLIGSVVSYEFDDAVLELSDAAAELSDEVNYNATLGASARGSIMKSRIAYPDLSGHCVTLSKEFKKRSLSSTTALSYSSYLPASTAFLQ